MSDILYDDHPESKDRLDLKKNKNKNKLNVSLLQNLRYFSTQSPPVFRHLP
jgi:hypothetical protein